MAQRFTVRTWATPLTIGAFFLMAATGVLMFFHIEGGLTTVVHQWCSWLFLAGAVGHVVANVKPFKNHFRSPFGQASVATFSLILVASFFTWGTITGPRLLKPVQQAIMTAPLSALAEMTQTPPEVLLRRFEAYGIPTTGQQSVRDLATRDHLNPNRLLGLVFLPE